MLALAGYELRTTLFPLSNRHKEVPELSDLDIETYFI
jgi:hypothetical protein